MFENVPSSVPVWMSHGDKVAEMPQGFRSLAFTDNSPVAVMGNDAGLIGLQFHPEVVHTQQGKEVIRNFLYNLCGCAGDWTPANFIEEQVTKIRAQVGTGRVICALSGGVDSTVVAAIIHRAIGDQLTCIFVDNGLLRLEESERVFRQFEQQPEHEHHPQQGQRTVPAPPRRRDRPGGEAQRDRRGVHRGVRGGGGEDRGRRLLGPRHALPRRHRERGVVEFGGHHQDASQRGGPARRDAAQADRAAAPSVQRRGARGRPGARTLRGHGVPPTLPRAGARDSASSAK